MTRRIFYPLLIVLFFLFIFQGNNGIEAQMKGGKVMEITSSAFEEGGNIPEMYTCDGANISPPLEWTAAPDGAKSFALICDDPDAPMGTWVHWVAYDLPVSISRLPENIPPERTPASGGKQGINDFNKIGYGGPCPPGGTHRYFFKLYALDTTVDLAPGATKEQLLKAMRGHILSEAQLMGKYRR
ncbi:MAG: YbhB/YbcL family Raf kinase inhibitor-like protein [Proteobacteria bacterium]|nr:YbhB/YbcL family Raf kinase inhibitor-like protein [Pseudomonadota bacterium]